MKKNIKLYSIILAALLICSGCGKEDQKVEITETKEASTTEAETEEITTEVITTEVITTEEITSEDEMVTSTPGDMTESYTPAVAGERFEMVRGGSYYVPEGFDNITKETYAVRYVQEWQNYSLDMHIMVTNCMQHDIPLTLDEDYQYFSDAYRSSAELSLDIKEEDGYILSGTTNSDQRIFYKKVKYIDDKYISIDIGYPASNADSCNKIVEDFVADFDYYK